MSSNKESYRKFGIGALPIEVFDKMEKEVYKESLVSLLHYFNGGGNGPEAKLACAALGTLAKREQASNNRKSLDLVVQKLQIQKLVGE